MVVLTVSPIWSLAANTTLWLPTEKPDCTFIINGHSPVAIINNLCAAGDKNLWQHRA